MLERLTQDLRFRPLIILENNNTGIEAIIIPKAKIRLDIMVPIIDI